MSKTGYLVHEGGLPGDRIFVEHGLLSLAEHEDEQLLGPHDAVDGLRRSAARQNTIKTTKRRERALSLIAMPWKPSRATLLAGLIPSCHVHHPESAPTE